MNPPVDTIEDPTDIPVDPVDTPDPDVENPNSTDLVDGKEVTDSGKAPEKTQTESDKPFWQTETTRQVNNLISVAAAAQKDYRANGERNGWMSKDGKLYSHTNVSYITTSTLVSDGYLESGLTPADYEILLVNGSDFSGYDGISVPSDSLGFTTFAVTKQSGKYLIASGAGKVGTLSAENYNAVLAKYAQSHGKIVRLSSASEEYARILNFICLYEGQFIDYSVRTIYKDNKYAVVILSPASNTAKIKQYILKNDSNFWEVVLPNLQTESYPITATNRYLPDFNIELLPNYNLAAWKNYLVTEQGGAMAAMFKNRFISSESEVAYQSGTASCYYYVLTNGTRYACYNAETGWEAVQVASDIDAVKYFKSKTGFDYGFIVKDD